MTIAPGMKDADMGAIVSAAQLEKVLGHIERAKQQGATLVCGGERYVEGDCAKGYFVRPTIFDNCTRDMDIVREEVFGPVVAIQTSPRRPKPLPWPMTRLTAWLAGCSPAMAHVHCGW
jgi:betaine-aldehyde dehydrogenase